MFRGQNPCYSIYSDEKTPFIIADDEYDINVNETGNYCTCTHRLDDGNLTDFAHSYRNNKNICLRNGS